MATNKTKKRIITFFIITTIFAVLLITIFSFYVVIPEVHNYAKEVNEKTVSNLKNEILTFIDNKVIETERIRDILLDLDQNSVTNQLNKYSNYYHDFENIYIFNNKGFTYGNVNLSKSEIVNTVSSKKDTCVYEKAGDKNQVYIISLGVRKDETWYVVTQIKNSSIERLLLSIKGFGIIFGLNGKEIAEIGKESTISDTDIAAINSEYQTLNKPIIDYKSNIAIIKNVFPYGWNVEVIAPKDAFYSSSMAIIYKIILVIAIIFIIIFLVLMYQTNIFIKIFNNIYETVDSIQDNRYQVKMPSEGIFSELTEKFNLMVKKIKGNYEEFRGQTEELFERNLEIEETNKELEVSYQKIQETISQLNEAEEKYYSLVKNLPEIICIIELDGTITFVNEAVQDILYYSKEEVIGQNISTIFEAELCKKLINVMNKKLKNLKKVVMELPMKRKDQKEIITEVKLSYYMRNGDVDGVQAVVRDITKNKRLQNEIMHKNKELLTIYNISKSLSSTIELDNVFKLIVNEVCNIFDAKYCMLRLLDSFEKKLTLRAYTGVFFNDVSEDVIEQFKNMDVEKVADAISQKKIIQMEAPEANGISDIINGNKIESEKVKIVVIVPICVKQKVLGIISVGLREKVKEKSINMLLAIASNAAVAIENATLYEKSKKYFIKTIEALIAAVEAKDKYTEGHSRRVSKYVEILASNLGLPKQTIEDLKIAGILHDVGKIGISDNILLKPGKLTDEEFEEIKQHPIISNRILYSVGLSETTMKAISCHHERYDGRGYPFGLKGDEMNIECQVIGVADAFDAMTSTRAYRRALLIEEAIKEIVKNRGTQFGPAVVDVIAEIFNKTPEVLTSISQETDLAS